MIKRKFRKHIRKRRENRTSFQKKDADSPSTDEICTPLTFDNMTLIYICKRSLFGYLLPLNL